MIRFGEVPVEDIVYNNSNCQLRINNGGFARGTLVMTNRFVQSEKLRSSSYSLFYVLARFAGSARTLRMAS